jgi:soluble lytic murein transglycosylase-like protein
MRRFVAPIFSGLALTLVAMSAPAAAATTVPRPAAIRAYAHVLQKINPQMPAWQSQDLAKHLLINAKRWKLDANLLVALVTVESSWHTHAESWAGAIGLGQLMPGTAATLHVNPHDPYQNLQGAARYLHGLLQRFWNKPDRYSLAFAAYNAGPKAVEEFGGIPPFYETQRYVVKVTSTWHRISAMVHVPKALPEVTVLAVDSPDVTYWQATR